MNAANSLNTVLNFEREVRSILPLKVIFEKTRPFFLFFFFDFSSVRRHREFCEIIISLGSIEVVVFPRELTQRIYWTPLKYGIRDKELFRLAAFIKRRHREWMKPGRKEQKGISAYSTGGFEREFHLKFYQVRRISKHYHGATFFSCIVIIFSPLRAARGFRVEFWPLYRHCDPQSGHFHSDTFQLELVQFAAKNGC